MLQRRALLLSIVLTLFLALSAIAIRSYFVDTSPAAGETVQIVTATSPAYTGDNSGYDDSDDSDHDDDSDHEDHDDDHDDDTWSSYADKHEDDDHDD